MTLRIKTKKVLLAAGCSYTDPNFESMDTSLDVRGGWPMWPELMAKDLGLNCINYGDSGTSNTYILNQIIMGLAKHGDNVDTVAVLLTAADRYKFFGWNLNPSVELSLFLDSDYKAPRAFEWLDDIGIGHVNVKYFTSDYFMPNTYRIIIDNYLCTILALIKICKSYNVKLIIMQGVYPLDTYVYNKLFNEGKIRFGVDTYDVLKLAIENPVLSELKKEKRHIIGWPLFSGLNGFSFDDTRKNNPEYRVSKNDFHPNALGQEKIKEYFMERYRAIYGH